MITFRGYNLCYSLAVIGIYDYHPAGEDEIGVKVGEKIELTTGPRGGQDCADGWWEGWYFHCAS